MFFKKLYLIPRFDFKITQFKSIPLLFKPSLKKIIFFLFLTSSINISFASPGDIIFEESFDNNGDYNSDWDGTGGGDSGVSNQTFNSIGSSLYLSGSGRVVTSKSNIINTNVPGAEITLWIRRGDDSFSENPDPGEDLVFEYLNSSNSWITLDTYLGGGTPGEIYTPTFRLPADGLYNNLRLRFRQIAGSTGFDFWHIDDIVVTEIDPTAIAGLIASWRFEELVWNGSNNEVLDSSGNNLHLTAFDAATSNVNPAITGNPGTCSYGVFNGSISFIQRDDDTSTADSLLDIPNTLTISVWINTNVIPTSGLKSIISKDENYEFHINTAGEIFWWWRWQTLTTSGLNLQTGRWYHIAVTWQSGEQIIYVDGVPRATSSRVGVLDINDDPLQVGQDLALSERFFDGYIDEVRIYENVLTAAEVNQVRNETHPCTASGTCTRFYVDKFDISSYSNIDGGDAWTGDWLETDDDGLATSGRMLITSGELRMTNSIGSNAAPSIEREADLSGAISATLKVALRTSNTLENGDGFTVSASSNGGVSWTNLQVFSNDINNTYTYDLAGFAAVNTRIRFSISQGYRSTDEFIYLNDLSIIAVKNCGPDHFRITHDGSGINCLREAISIRAEDSANAPVTDYAGTVSLNLSTSNGNWFTLDNNGVSADLAQGTLTDTPADNNGAATYLFNTADQGTVTLYLENTVAETTNISVNDGSILDENSEGDITFRPFGFVFSPNPIDTQIGGRPFDITLTAAGQTPAQPECGVIEEYTGVKALNFWANSPATTPTQVSVNGANIAQSEPSSISQNVTFTAGIATISSLYNDVGQISISAKDETGIGDPVSGTVDEIIGGISPFIVRPFAYDIQVTGNPNATNSTDPIFAIAGNNFPTTIRSILWQAADDLNNDGIPDGAANLADNGITPNIVNVSGSINLSSTAQLVANNGNLGINNLNFNQFITTGSVGEGTALVSQSWDEVGIITINANTAAFMTTGGSVSGIRTNIGRFIPNHFDLALTPISNTCSGFTYGGYLDLTPGLTRNGQPFEIEGQVQAYNSLGGITRNYTGDFLKLNQTNILATGYDFDTTNLITTLNFAVLPANLTDNGNGTVNFEEPAVHYQFNTERGPLNLFARLGVTDSDGVTTAPGINWDTSVIEQRLGRMILQDSYGPEINDLEMRLKTEYFDGTLWSLNTQDSCSTYQDSLITVGPYSGTGGTAVQPTLGLPIVPTLLSGNSELGNGIWFDAPGNGNYGSALINLDLSTQGWLRYDWNADNSIENFTSGTLNFGYYRGSDRVIYWQER